MGHRAGHLTELRDTLFGKRPRRARSLADPKSITPMYSLPRCLLLPAMVMTAVLLLLLLLLLL